MILAVDCGNSRLKWGLHDRNGWLKSGTVPLAGLAKVERTWKKIPAPDKIVIASVAGQSARRKLNGIPRAGDRRSGWRRRA
jgi:type III pantothenate kinase